MDPVRDFGRQGQMDRIKRNYSVCAINGSVDHFVRNVPKDISDQTVSHVYLMKKGECALEEDFATKASKEQEYGYALRSTIPANLVAPPKSSLTRKKYPFRKECLCF